MVIDKIKKREETEDKEYTKPDIPVGKWVKCDSCKEILYKEFLRENFSVCPNCGYHFRLSSRRRIAQIIDEGTFEEFDINIDTVNPLKMDSYVKKIEALREKTGLDEAVKCGMGKINGEKVVICVMDRKLFNWKYGKRSWRKNNIFNRRSNKIKTSCYNIFCFRWSKDARRHNLSNANGKDIVSSCKT